MKFSWDWCTLAPLPPQNAKQWINIWAEMGPFPTFFEQLWFNSIEPGHSIGVWTPIQNKYSHQKYSCEQVNNAAFGLVFVVLCL